ncbi:protein associated with UVRAG as autophagy enhancer isoform X2 [Trichosurus vulpecula]|uniref:protein associated with UVRAG as autophagy enhancer isoform X2 n=1 Tax=Trichosurus vulpecula TaxID=9337 RepID=UPI00186B4BB5|nr:protein associated with UVRAG as autophagy enhancer isoform X2 [Trichosurus vulpecula]
MSSLQSLPLATYSQVTNQLRPPSLISRSQLMCMDSVNLGCTPPSYTSPRISCPAPGPQVFLHSDQLSRPLVAGHDRSTRSHPNGMEAIREIFLSVLNLSRPGKMVSQAAGRQEFAVDSWKGSSDESEDTGEGCSPSHTPLPLSQVDIRSARHKAAWINLPQCAVPAEGQAQLPDSSTPVPVHESNKAHFITSHRPFPLGCSPTPPGDSLTATLLLGDSTATEGSSLNCSEEMDTCLSLSSSEQHVMVPESLSPSAILTRSKIPARSQVLVNSSTSHWPLKLMTPIEEGTIPASRKALPLNSFSPETLMLPADVEKENAHFYAADIIISVMETMKYNLLNQQPGESGEGLEVSGSLGIDQTDLERGFYIPEKQKSSSATSSDSGYEGCSALQVNPVVETTIHQNGLKEFCECDSDDFVIVELEDFDKITETCRCFHDMNKRYIDEPSFNSAELIAKDLYRAFCRRSRLAEVDFHLAGSLQADRAITVNEDSLRKDFESSLDVVEEIKFKSRIRGTKDWTPPKFEIIFNVHPPLKRDFVVSTQNFSCAGCGTPIEQKYVKRLRYCDYLGKYFCDCCHSYAESYIPARILMNWDFRKYYVSKFSKHLLDSIWHQPLINLLYISPNLYSKAKELDQVREIQEKLVRIKKLLKTCRFAESCVKERGSFVSFVRAQPSSSRSRRQHAKDAQCAKLAFINNASGQQTAPSA